MGAKFYLIQSYQGVQNYLFVPCKGFWIPNSGKFLPVESGIHKLFVVKSAIVGFGIQNAANDWDPECKFPLTENPESTALNPESQTASNFLTWGESFNMLYPTMLDKVRPTLLPQFKQAQKLLLRNFLLSPRSFSSYRSFLKL